MNNLQTGRLGEVAAKNLLISKGYRILYQNYRSRWGEIDIIAGKDKKITFVEVKTRIGDVKSKPYESVTKRKINNLRRPIEFFLLRNHYEKYKFSLDVISIIFNRYNEITELKHFENINLYD